MRVFNILNLIASAIDKWKILFFKDVLTNVIDIYYTNFKKFFLYFRMNTNAITLLYAMVLLFTEASVLRGK